jgi:ribosomal-protein-alanine N-acetyltransferase
MIRRMNLNDIEKVMKIELEAFSQPWTFESFFNEISNNNLAYYFVIEKDNEIIGYLGMWKIIDEGHITNIAIDKEYRKMGYGHILVYESIEFMKNDGVTSFTLEVRVTNNPAIKLYEKMGFTRAGIRKKYYQDNGEDALIMWYEV